MLSTIPKNRYSSAANVRRQVQNSGELGIIRLHGVTVDQVLISQSKKKRKNVFEIQTPNRVYYLSAETEPER
jgi:hypothetical protein